MSKTTFTVDQLQAAINEAILIEKMFPDLPIKLPFTDEFEFWREGTFPITFKKIGNDQEVTLKCKEFFDGEEGGDHNMRCVMTVGWGSDMRYFLKTGLYDSWDSSEWDGPILEVEPKTIEVIQWVTRASREQGNQN